MRLTIALPSVPDAPFQSFIPSREDWNDVSAWNAGHLNFFTDGSKLEGRVGGGVFCPELDLNISFRLPDYCSVFQAELAAVSEVPKWLMRNITTSTTINIFTDSQAAIKSLNSMTIRSKTVRDCLTALTEVANYFQIKIAWVPGHSDIPGNCKADELARAGTHLQNRSIRENLNIPFATCRLLIDKWADDMFQEKWDNVGSCRVAKLTWPTINRNRTKQLLELPRSRISLTVGVLTGHCLIGSHAARLRVPVSDFCRSCRDEEEEESPQHLLLNCPALARLRFKHMGSYFFNSLSELAEISPASVSNFVRSTKWFVT